MSAKKTNSAKKEAEKTVTKAVADTKKNVNGTQKVVKENAKKVVNDTAKKAEATKKVVKKTAEKVHKDTKQVADKAKKTVSKTAQKVVTKELYFEYADKQINADNLADMAVSAYKSQGNKDAVKSLRLYVKAEDNALYYVVNDTVSGTIEL